MDKDDDNFGTYSSVIGVVLAAAASLISNLGVNMQKLAHKRIANLPKDDPRKKSYSTHPVWVVGIVLIIAGSIADLAALGFAAQSIIAPLGALTLVANVFFAPFILGEKVTRREILATTAIVMGCAVAVGFASHKDQVRSTQTLFDLYLEPRFFGYLSGVLVMMGVMLYSINWIEKIQAHERVSQNDDIIVGPRRRYKDYVKYHRFLYASLSGTMGAQNVLFAKCAAELMINTFSGEDIMFGYYQTYLVLSCLGITIFFQIRWLNSGLQRFDALYIVPVFQSFWILVSVVSGLIFFAEYKGLSPLSMILYSVGVLITIMGVFVLSGRGVSNVSDMDKKESIALDSNKLPLLDNEVTHGNGINNSDHDDENPDDTSSVSSLSVEPPNSPQPPKRRSLFHFPIPRSQLVEDKLDDWLGKGHDRVPVSISIASMYKINSLVEKHRRHSEAFSHPPRSDATINGLDVPLENIVENLNNSGDDETPLLHSPVSADTTENRDSRASSRSSYTESEGSSIVDLRDYHDIVRSGSGSGSGSSDGSEQIDEDSERTSLTSDVSDNTDRNEPTEESTGVSSVPSPQSDRRTSKSEAESEPPVLEEKPRSSDALSPTKSSSSEAKSPESPGDDDQTASGGQNDDGSQDSGSDKSDDDHVTDQLLEVKNEVRNQRSNTLQSSQSYQSSDFSDDFVHTPETDSMIGSSAQSTPQSTPKIFMRKKHGDIGVGMGYEPQRLTAAAIKASQSSYTAPPSRIVPPPKPEPSSSSAPDEGIRIVINSQNYQSQEQSAVPAASKITSEQIHKQLEQGQQHDTSQSTTSTISIVGPTVDSNVDTDGVDSSKAQNVEHSGDKSVEVSEVLSGDLSGSSHSIHQSTHVTEAEDVGNGVVPNSAMDAVNTNQREKE